MNTPMNVVWKKEQKRNNNPCTKQQTHRRHHRHHHHQISTILSQIDSTMFRTHRLDYYYYCMRINMLKIDGVSIYLYFIKLMKDETLYECYKFHTSCDLVLCVSVCLCEWAPLAICCCCCCRRYALFLHEAVYTNRIKQ